jgi:hypothetical protein
MGFTVLSELIGGRVWDADCGDDCQDTSGTFCPGQADKGDLPRLSDKSRLAEAIRYTTGRRPALAVEPQQVVPRQVQDTDWWF